MKEVIKVIWMKPEINAVFDSTDIEEMDLLGDWTWKGQLAGWAGQKQDWSGQNAYWAGQAIWTGQKPGVNP